MKSKGFTPLEIHGAKKTHKARKSLTGFTLIELLVVVAVIGLLASVTLVFLGPSRKKARDARRQSDLEQIHLAMELCYDEENCATAEAYPDTEPGVNTLAIIDKDGTPLLLEVSKDPSDSPPFQYTWINGTDRYYCLYAKLEAVPDTYFCASNKGLKQKTATGYTPSKDDCCGYDVDD